MYIHAYDKADAVASETKIIPNSGGIGDQRAVRLRSWYHGTRNGPLSLFSDVHPRVGRRHKFIVSAIRQYPTVYLMVSWCGADGRQHKLNGARATGRLQRYRGTRLRRYRGTRLHTVLVRRKRERALFAAGKNRTARVDDNRDAALFNGNRKCDRGHRLLWCTSVYKRIPWSAVR